MPTTTGLVTSLEFLKHDTGFGHPERAARLKAIFEAIEDSPIRDALVRLEPRPATVEEIERVHAAEHVAFVRRLAEGGGGRLDYDTPIGERSYEIARLAAGAAIRAVDAVLDGEVSNAVALVRPPGHHATPTRGMGFCLFNNLAIAAQHARVARGVSRILIVDWDVHHGNGTQEAFYAEPEVLFFSIHQHPLYPGTGMSRERGHGKGFGSTINVPVPAGSTDQDYCLAFETHLIPAAHDFEPELVMISAGFDAHRSDPLAGVQMTTPGFGLLTELVRGIADECCAGRIVSTLEGGYSLHAVAASVVTHLERLAREA